ncbi:hypothetical protein ScPMuIL_001273 [Solemya velum]
MKYHLQLSPSYFLSAQFPYYMFVICTRPRSVAVSSPVGLSAIKTGSCDRMFKHGGRGPACVHTPQSAAVVLHAHCTVSRDSSARDIGIVNVPSDRNDPNGNDGDKVYKRVAVVDDFFDIIYGVHVEMDGRGGKHAGQKRTYRAIAETYAFLPREAVTRFLMSCSDCQKRMHLASENSNNNNNNSVDSNLNVDDAADDSCLMESHGLVTDDPPHIDFSLPITQTYLNHMRNKGYIYDEEEERNKDKSHQCDARRGNTRMSAKSNNSNKPPVSARGKTSHGTIFCIFLPDATDTRGGTHVSLSSQFPKSADQSPTEEAAINMSSKTSPHPQPRTAGTLNGNAGRATTAVRNSSTVPGALSSGSWQSFDSYSIIPGTPIGRRPRPNRSLTRTSESGAADDQGGKDEDEDEENEDDEKMPAGNEYDPERLKAFNMFCRLFVDENLDRMVPISKQPKDKIQAILEACDRQFPEFHVRSRKRIRTYLKSCRRMRRTKEQNGWEPLRPTPPHLTSAAAEGLLAQACENESNNAKRMRMGLEPLPASAMRSAETSLTINQTQSTPTPVQSPSQLPVPLPTQTPQPQLQQQPQQQTPQPQTNSTPQQTPQAHTATPQPLTAVDRHVPTNNDVTHHQPPPPSFRPPPEFPPPFFLNGNGLFRPGFPPGYQHPAHHHPTVPQHSPIQPSSVQNGPTDLSMKKSNSKNQLSSSEIATIKQLIAGYRESAAFLYRSADELEQLLLQQN